MRVLSPRIHGYLDFAVVVIFLLAPLALGLGGTPALVSYLLAIVHLVMTLMTRFPAGISKKIPFMVHGFIELAVAIFLVLLPTSPALARDRRPNASPSRWPRSSFSSGS